MNKLIFGFMFVLFITFGCNKENPKPTNTIKIEDLVGTWVSSDSALRKNANGDFVYTHDTILFTNDTNTLVLESIKGIPMLHRNFISAFYQYKIEEIDMLVLKYLGPEKIMAISKHKIAIKDGLLTIDNNWNLYPTTLFPNYKKIQ